MTRVLLTGAAGFLGAHTLRRWLATTDFEFVCPVSFRHKGLPERLTWAMQDMIAAHEDRVDVVRHDLATPVNATTASLFGAVDVIVNYASDTHPPRSVAQPVEFVHNNVDIALYLLEYARTLGGLQAFVQISTDSVYGPAPTGEHEEWDPIVPNNPYCLVPGTDVLTRRGPVPIESFDVTQHRVLSRAGSTSGTPDGLARRTWQFDHSGEVLTIRTHEGRESITCTPDHRFFVRVAAHANGGSRMVERRAADLQVGDRVAVVRRLPFPTDAHEVEAEYARLLGYWLADGSYSQTRNRYVRLADQDRAMIDFYRDQATIACGPSLTRRSADGLTGTVYKHGLKDCWYLQFASNALLDRVDLRDRMNVTDQAMNFGPESLGQFIAGWIDGDGCVNRDGDLVKSVSVTSYDPRLRRLLKFLLRRLGVVAVHDDPWNRVTVHDARSLQLLRDAAPSRKWRPEDTLRRPQRKRGLAANWIWARVESVERSDYDGKVYDLEVQPHHNYVASYFLVHNSASKAAQEALGISYWRSFGVPYVIAATMNPTGETQDVEKFVPMTIGKLLRGDMVTIHADGSGSIGSRTYIYGGEVAAGVLHILRELPPAAYGSGTDRPDRWNIVGQVEIDNLTMAEMLAAALQVKLKCRTSTVDRPEHGHRYAMSGAKLAAAGWKAGSDIGPYLARMARWTRQNPLWLTTSRS